MQPYPKSTVDHDLQLERINKSLISRLLPQPPLNPLPRLPLRLLNLPSRTIKPDPRPLIERILWVFFKLLPHQLHPLLLPQPGALLFHLRQPPLLVRLVRRSEPSLGVPVDLHAVVLLCERQRVERVFDVRGV